MMQPMVLSVFNDVYNGDMHTTDAGRVLHYFCDLEGLNPTADIPITTLMMSDDGMGKLKKYEEFICHTRWIIARLAVKDICVKKAYDEFYNEVSIFDDLYIDKDVAY